MGEDKKRVTVDLPMYVYEEVVGLARMAKISVHEAMQRIAGNATPASVMPLIPPELRDAVEGCEQKVERCE